MGKELKRLARRKRVLDQLDKMTDRPEDVLIIHYSCESFYDRDDGTTPRVTSIAVRNLDSGQTESFSIHKIAEQKKLPFDEIHNHYDQLEHEMLKEYFDFANENQGMMWVHWNMRDINYGFSALEHRFKALSGTPFVLSEGKKFDLARALVSKYGIKYIGHPRLAKLVEKNHIADRDFLTGEEEANAFDNKEYVKLHQSTLRKVDILANILERTADGSLKTNAKWYEIYGVHPKTLIELARQHWLVSLIGIIALIGSVLRLLGIL